MVDTPKWVERWEKQRPQGPRRFILTMGGSYGLAMFIAMTFLGGSNALTSRLLMINAVVWAAGGLLFGAVMWWLGEWRYRRFLKSRAADAGTAV